MNPKPVFSRRQAIQALAGAGALCSMRVMAQAAYPSRPITWVVPYAPGAATDVMTRRLAQDIAADLGQPIAVENMPGGATVSAASQLARARPDGYRFMTADSATLALNPALMEKLPYDPRTSFSYLGMFARFPLFLVVHKDLPVKSVSELIDYIKQRNGEATYASAGMGSPHHLAMELLLEGISARMVHVPYNGAGAALTDLIAGRTGLMFSSLGTIVPHLKSGALRVIAVSGSERSSTQADVPTVAEGDARLKGFEVYAWQGVVAPAGLPDEVRTRFSASLQKVAASEAVKKRFLELGIEAVADSPAAFERYASIEARKWAELVKSRGIKRE
ncbi:MAG: tripartite tricarboxylate transporter substrate binding protein [Burkholderiales bacterium]|nr:tripartite tricarboxylate transporter substrate binding protein [Burkholderiales bacterium]